MALDMIDNLVADLKPVHVVSSREGFAVAAAATCFAVLMVALLYGLRSDIVQGAPNPIVVVRSGMLLVLGVAALSAVITSARPGIGQRSTGWRWALAAAALFPVTSAVLAMANMPEAVEAVSSSNAIWCLMISTVSGTFIGGLLTGWLRQGAPTSINRTAWLVGLAAGSFGTFAYGLHCPSTTVYYIGLWYSLAILLSAIGARLIVPRFIRW
jgi:hypothetical protein